MEAPLNNAICVGLGVKAQAARPRFARPTYPLGTDRIELRKALALVDELESEETIRNSNSAKRT